MRWSSEVLASSESSVPAVSEANGFGLRLARIQKFRGWEFGTPTERGHVPPTGPAPWLEAAAVTEGRRWGVVVMPHPDNPVPAFIGGRIDNSVPEIRVTPKPPNAAVGDIAFTILPDRPLRMRCGMFFFETAATEPINPAAVFRDYVANE